MFKHILSLALAITFVFSFAACTENPEAVPTETEQRTTAPAEINDVLKTNKIKHILDVMPKYNDPETTFTENKNIDGVAGYFGKNLAALDFKNTPADGFAYGGDDNFKITYNKRDMTVAYDYCFFRYIQNKKNFTVTASRLSTPINFTYELETDDKTDFKLADGATKQIAVGFKPKNEQPGFDYDLYVAEFEQNGVYYKIEGENVTDKEFYCVISAVLNAEKVSLTSLPGAQKSAKTAVHDSAIYYSGGQKKTLSKDETKAITDKLNYYLENEKTDAPSLWVIEETAGKVKNEQKCVELIYNTEQKSQNTANSVWDFNKLLIILDGKDNGMIMHAEKGVYDGGAVTVFDEGFTKDILSIINEGG